MKHRGNHLHRRHPRCMSRRFRSRWSQSSRQLHSNGLHSRVSVRNSSQPWRRHGIKQFHCTDRLLHMRVWRRRPALAPWRCLPRPIDWRVQVCTSTCGTAVARSCSRRHSRSRTVFLAQSGRFEVVQASLHDVSVIMHTLMVASLRLLHCCRCACSVLCAVRRLRLHVYIHTSPYCNTSLEYCTPRTAARRHIGLPRQ